MNFQKLKDAQDRLEKAGGNRLGSLLWWSLSSNSIQHDALKSVASTYGLPSRYLPKEIKPTQAFRRAWRRAASKLPPGQMLRPIADSPDQIVIGLVREQADEAARDLEYDLLARIAFDKHSQRLTADVENGVSAQIQELYEIHLGHSTEDVRAMLTSFLAEAGIPLRQSGGVYLVAPNFEAVLSALCGVVERVGDNCTYRLPVFDSPGGRRALQDVARKSLDDEIQLLEAELNRFDDDKVRESTLERKLESFEEIRSRVSLFSQVLQFKSDDLSNKIGTIQASLRHRLGIDPMPQPRAKPSKTDNGRSPISTVAPFAGDVGF